jgi:prepilin-type N-terminal cleavage/methylation domain-containing protein
MLIRVGRWFRLNDRAFTLIELLIVIAIILILISIALPNFLEAQLRARVTRARGSLHSLATALNTYRLDFNIYPDDQDEDPFSPTNRGLFQLTTPIKYMTSLPFDPLGPGNFDSQSATGPGPSGGQSTNSFSPIFAMASTGGAPNEVHRRGFGFIPPPKRVNAFCVYSHGVDKLDDFTSENDFPFSAPVYPVVAVPGVLCVFSAVGARSYSPTNGTRSFGDILQLGGEWRSGLWCLDGNEIRGYGADFNRSMIPY